MADIDLRSDSITTILSDLGEENASFEQIIPKLYDDLRHIAHNHLKGERADHTLATTALVHEAYIRMSRESGTKWKNKSHFCAVSSIVMRRVLVDYARSKKRIKRGGGEVHKVALEDVNLPMEDILIDEIIGIDEALKKLAKINKRAADLVQCRFFSGLTLKETAEALDLSMATVQKSWATAKAWLMVELEEYDPAHLSRKFTGNDFEE